MNSRRSFLASIGAAAFAPHALSALPPQRSGEYVVGTTSNPHLPGAWGERVLKAWVSVAEDGTGFGVLTDRYDSAFSGHLAVRATARHGGRYRWEGIITRSNDAGLLHQPIVLSAVRSGGTASLELLLLGQSFRGSGLVTLG